MTDLDEILDDLFDDRPKGAPIKYRTKKQAKTAISRLIQESRIDELERQPWFDADQQTYIKNRIAELEKGTE